MTLYSLANLSASSCIYVGHHNRQKIRSQNMSEMLSACWFVALLQFDRLLLYSFVFIASCSIWFACALSHSLWPAIKFWWALSTKFGTYHNCTLQWYSVRILSWINLYSKSRHYSLANFIYTRLRLGSFNPLYLQIAVPSFQLSSTHCSFI